MSRRRATALFRRVAEEIRRDRPSLALLFVAPIVIMGLVTFIVREGQTPEVEAVIVNEAGASGVVYGTALTASLQAQGATVRTASDRATAGSMIADRTATVGIVLPAGLGHGAGATITVITNGMDPAAEGSQVVVVSKAMVSAAASVTGITPPTIEHATVYGTPSSDPIADFAPALVAFFTYFFVYILTGVSFLRERTGGTLERLMATPVTRGEVVAGYTLGFGVFAMAQVALIMAWVLGTIHVPSVGPMPEFSIGLGIAVAGEPLLAYAVVILAALGAVSLGIFVSTFARTELQVSQFIPIVIVPQFLLSGVLFPISTLPAAIAPFAVVMPMTYAVDGLRQVFIRGADLSVTALQVDLLVLTGFAILFAVVASRTIRRDVA